MKNYSIAFLFIISCSLTCYAQKEINIDLEKSEVHWTGSKLFGFGKHYGTVKFKKGKLFQINDKITGGIFTIDMKTIINTDGKYSEMLVDHLKNKDFFHVKKYPIAQLIMTQIKYDKNNGRLNIKADLTIKNKTNPIEFQAELSEDQRLFKAEFIIDRTDWKITYESKGFAAVKNQVISDAIEFRVSIVLKQI